ncbi:MAG: FAD-dependent oxidoreductase [Rhodobacteraceae bacterium]|nr:FAD-dependent oxidoreductase [Paracoccaceae bacterium]
MTRRTLMQAAAATTGLATLGAPLRALPANPDVVVIGAGAAGIAAARTLIGQGLEVTVIEAASRIGGRAWTETDTLGAPFDRGASWLQGPADAAHVRLAQANGFELRDHSNPRDVLFIGDRRADTTESRQRDRTWSSFYSALLNARGDVAADTVVPMDANFANVISTWMGPMDFGVDMDQLSRMDWYAFAEFGANYLVREGVGTLVAGLGHGLPVQLNTAAHSVDWSGEGVTVETSAGTIRARACIVTVSTGVLASGAIRFTPELPDAKQTAIADLPMGQLLKIGLMFDGTRFGLSPGDFLSHDIAGDLPSDACYYLAFPNAHDYIVGFAGGRFGRDLEREGEAAAIAFALERLQEMLGSDVRRHFQRGTMAGWDGNPLARGAYSAARPGGFGARRALAEPLGERVFFAGEAMAIPYATLVTGAHMHGESVAQKVAAQLGAPGCDGCAARGQDKGRRIGTQD